MALNLIIDPSVDTTFTESVRNLLGGAMLDDSVITDPVIFDLVELDLISAIPCIEAGTLDARDIAKVKMAMTYIVASKLCPTAQAQTEYEVRTIDVTWKKKPVDYSELSATLLSTADSILSGVDCYTGGADFNIFAVAPSKRGVTQNDEL